MKLVRKRRPPSPPSPELLKDEYKKTFQQCRHRRIGQDHPPLRRPPPKARRGNSSGTMNSMAPSWMRPSGRSCPMHQRKDGWWMRKAVSLDGQGHLVISTIKEGDRFIDGCVRTKGKFEHSFGYYVARVQFRSSQDIGRRFGSWARRGQGRQRWPRRHRNRHLGKALAG